MTSLGSQAFKGCSKLKTVRLPKALMGNITETDVFSGCPSDMEIRYYGSEKPSGSSYTFSYEIVSAGAGGSRTAELAKWTTTFALAISPSPSSDATVTIPDTLGGYNVKSIATWSFLGAAMKGVVLPKYLTTINAMAFQNCSNLASVTVPDSVTKIADLAFYNCSSLKAASVPKAFIGSLTESSVFYNCSSSLAVTYRAGTSLYAQKSGSYYWYYRLVNGKAELYNGSAAAISPKPSSASISVPSALGGATLNSIGQYAFYGCSGMTGVTLPSTVTNVGASAFYNCSGLKSVSGLTNVKGFGASAFRGCSALTTITLPSGLTSIPDYLFYNCSALTSVTIPSTVKSIGSYAFENCSKLTSVTIPDSVTSMGTEAFYGCYGLTSVTIGSGLTSIPPSAFRSCSALTRIYIPSTVTSLGNNAFYGCTKLYDVHVSKALLSSGLGTDVFANCSASLDTRYYGSETDANGYTWYYELMVRGGQRVAEIVRRVPTNLNNYNYAITGLPSSGNRSVKMPSTLGGYTVVSIGRSAFWSRSTLSGMTIANTVTNISPRAFAESGILTVTVPDSVTVLQENAFQSCASLRTASLPGALCGKIDESKVFSSCPSDLEVSYRVSGTVSKQKVGDYFWYFKVLPTGTSEITYQLNSAAIDPKPTGSVTIPSKLGGRTVTGIGVSAFDSCTGLTGVGTIPSTVTNFGNYAFWKCSALQSITMPSSLKRIGIAAFQGCSNAKFTTVTIPNSVTSMGSGVFNGCTSLKTVKLGTGLKTLSNGAFKDCSALTYAYVPENVTSIEDDVFKNCTSLTRVHLKNSTFLGKIEQSNICSGCPSDLNIRYYGTLESGGLVWYYESVTKNDVILDTELARWYTTSFGQAVKTSAGAVPSGTVTIPSSIAGMSFTTIGKYAFYNMPDVTEVVIPSTVKKIDTYAFQKSGIETVYVPDSVTTLANYTFSGCASLETASLPGAFFGAINESLVFSGCPDVNITYRISGSVKAEKMGDYYWCYKIVGDGAEIYRDGSTSGDKPAIWPKPTGSASISIPATMGGKPVRNIGNGAFANCAGIAEVEIPNTVTNIGKNAFRGTSLAGVTIPGSVERISYGAFYGCTSLQDVSLANGLKYIDTYAFYNCKELTEIVLPNTLKEIGQYAFQGCAKLATLTINSGVTSIGLNAFDKTALATVYVAGGNVNHVKELFTASGLDISGISFIDLNAWQVTFNANGGSGGTTRAVSKGSTLGTLPSASRTGYTFKGWFTDPVGGSQVTASTTPTSDVTYYAHWEVKQYTLTFNANGGDGGTSMTLDYNSTLVAPVVTRAGYTFLGWSPELPAKVPAANTTYTAQWELIPVVYHTVTFNAEGGIVSGGATREVEDGKAVGALPGATKTGYTFNGWFTAASGGTQITSSTQVTADVTYHAQWTIIPPTVYTVTFNVNGGEGADPTAPVQEGNAIATLPPEPTRTGYTFLGWFTAATGGTLVDGSTVVAANATYYAHWQANEYTVAFDATDGTCDTPSKVVTYDSTYGELPVATREGYTFDGWFTAAADGTKVEADTEVKITEDQTLFAQWTEIPPAVIYTVTFDPQSGSPVASREVEAGEEVGTLPTTSRDGYTFNGWFTDATGGTKISASTTVTANVTYYAQWTETAVPKYTVMFDAKGGTCDTASVTVNAGDPIGAALPSATRDGYTFAGWMTGESISVDATTVVNDNMSCWAMWTPNTYMLTLDAAGGTVSPDQVNVTYDSAYGSLPVASKSGYAFKGWFTAATGGTQIKSDTVVKITSDTTLYAQWTEIVVVVHTVTFDANGGTCATPSISVKDGSTIGAALPSATRDGYTFVGWKTGASTPVDAETAVDADMSCWADWTPNTYTLTLDATGGTVSPDHVDVTYDSAYGTLPDAVRGSDTFKGWFTAATGGTQIKSDTIVEITADTTLYAQWLSVVCEVTFDAQGGVPAPASVMVNKGDQVGALPVVTKSGHTFKGWFDAPSGGTQITASTEVATDVTYYAQWTEIVVPTYTVTFDAQGGTPAPAVRSVKDGDQVGTLPVVTKSGYDFKGWFTAATGGERVYDTTAIGGNITIYAQWNATVAVFSIVDGVLTHVELNGVTDVVIPDGVTAIAEHVFEWADITSVVIPEGVTSIGDNAFAHCNSLTSVVIPGTVTAIGNYAFSNDESLQEVVFSDGITSVGNFMFYNCLALTSATLPKSLTSIGQNAFDWNDAVWPTFPGVVTVKVAHGDTDRINAIWEEAWHCAMPHVFEELPPTTCTVTFDAQGGTPAPADATLVVDDAFGSLPAVTKEDYKFKGWFTEPTGGTKVEADTTVTGDTTLYAQWEEIPVYTVTFDAQGGTPATAGISGKEGAELGELPVATKSGALFVGWFTEATGGTEVTPKTVITGDATYYAQWITEGWWPDSDGVEWFFKIVDDHAVIGDGSDAAIPSGTTGSIVVPPSIYGYPVTGVGDRAFYTCTKVKSITIPEGVTTIGAFAFWGCMNLESVSLPASLTGSIGESAFYGCSALESVTIPDGVTDIGGDAFLSCSALKNITMGKNLASISATALYGCVALETVTYLGSCPTVDAAMYGETPETLVSIVPGTGWETQLAAGTWCGRAIRTDAAPITFLVTLDANGGSVTPASVLVDEGASIGTIPTPEWTGHDFSGWFTDPTAGAEVTAAFVPAADTVIFAHWTEIAGESGAWTDTETDITWYYRPATDGIGVELYRNESEGDHYQAIWPLPEGGVTVVIPPTIGGKPVTGIGENAFVLCTGMSGVEIPDTVTYIGDWAFAQSGLTGIDLPAGLTTIGEYAFYGCEHLTSVVIPSGVTSIGAGAFANNSALTEVTIPSTVTSLGADAFSGSPITTVHVEEGKSDDVRRLLEDSGLDTTGISIPDDAGTGATKWTVTFNANGGSVSPTTRAVTNGKAVGTLPIPILAGYDFKGWFTAAEGGSEVTEAYTPTADMEIFAHWKALSSDKYKVTLDLNGGSYSETALEYDAGDPIGYLPIPEGPEGNNNFLGWFWESGDEVKPTDEVTGNCVCQARWGETQATMSALVNGIRWSYFIAGNGVTLYNNGRPVIPADYEGALIIPAKIANKSVTAIGQRAFYGCTGLTSVLVPDSTTLIRTSAFAWCENLSVVQLGKSMSPSGMIEEKAFQGCAKLKVMDCYKCKTPPRIIPEAFDLVPTIPAVNVYRPKTWNQDSAWYPYESFNDYSFWMNSFMGPFYAKINVGFKDPDTGPVRGTIKLSGATEIGKTYTLKATVNKNYAFAGWWDGVTGERVSRALSYAYTVTGEDKTFLADFVMEYEDYSSLAIAQGDVTTDDDGAVEIDLGAATTSYSEPKLTVKGLPTGLKYDAKTLKVTGTATKPGKYSVTVTATNASRKNAKEGVTVTFTLTVPNFKDATIPVEDSYGPFIPGVPLDPVTLVEATGCKVTGLPTGMKWTEKDVVDNKTKTVTVPAYSFYGTPTKPGNYTVYFTKTTTDKVKHTATATFVVDRLLNLKLVMSGNTGKDSVKGEGSYEANKKVSLKATADKGKVFSCWIDNSTGDIVDRAASYSYVMPSVDTTLTGMFVTEEEDRKHLATTIGGFASYDQNKSVTFNEKTIDAGVYVEWPVDADTRSFATIKVSGLPTGLKFTAKDVVDSKTKAVIVKANTIYGAPTAASKVDAKTGTVKPSEVKITVTTAGKVKANYVLNLYVNAMETWAVGTFNGGIAGTDVNGQATLTVANTGKISGKYLTGGLTATLTADSFTSYAGGVYEARVTAKVGQSTATWTLGVTSLDIGGGQIVGNAMLVDEYGNVVADLWQTNWKNEPWKTIAKPFAKAQGIGYGYFPELNVQIDLKFASSGAVTTKFTAGTPLTPSGTTYKASGSSTLIPFELYGTDGSFGAYIYVYIPPKAGKFDGYTERKYIRWNAATGQFTFDLP